MKKEVPISSIDNRMNEERFADLFREVETFEERIDDPDLKKLFHNAFFNTILTTLFFEEDGSAFVITGDIPAMWLRDSAAQVMQYLHFAKTCPSVCQLIRGVLKKQFTYVLTDSYANAFNREDNGMGHTDDIPQNSPWVWERKFELDSLTYPLWLLTRYVKATEDESVMDETFYAAFDKIIATFRTEQRHAAFSSYYHERPNKDRNDWCGNGSPVKENGLVWSGYRPSDDSCTYNYYIPGNMFICTALTALRPLFLKKKDEERAKKCADLTEDIRRAIDECGKTTAPDGSEIYALETDGMGHYNVMDDANIPNLLSIPYYDYPFADKKLYENTRAYMLSKRNPYYYEGSAITGIGSPHTPEGYVWPLSLIIQAMTSNDEEEIKRCVSTVASSTGGTYYIHEGVYKDDDTVFTRPWFAWANSLFADLVLRKADILFPKK